MNELQRNKQKEKEKIYRIIEEGIQEIQGKLRYEMPTNPPEEWDDIRTEINNKCEELDKLRGGQ